MADDVEHATDDSPHRATITRTVELDADPDAVWHAVEDADERSLWLDDPDAAARHVRVDEARPGERLVWTWWRPGDEGEASTVTVELQPAGGGGTHVVVTEALPAHPPVARAAAGRATGTARLALRCDRDRWDARLLGLELLFVTAAARVG